jgi:RHS repeat-associated protein
MTRIAAHDRRPSTPDRKFFLIKDFHDATTFYRAAAVVGRVDVTRPRGHCNALIHDSPQQRTGDPYRSDMFMKIRSIGRAIRLAAMAMPVAGLSGIAWAQSPTDFALEYCYQGQCRPTKDKAIELMEAANPAGYVGKYVEIDSEVSLSTLRPLSFTFNVNPEGPVSVGASVYGMSGANPAPYYCGASGAEIFPNSCSSEAALVQGFIDRETAVYGGNARHTVEARDGHVPTFMSIHYPPPGSSPQLGVYLQSWEVTSRRPGAVVWKIKENGEPAGYSSSLYVDKHTPFTCAADFYPKAGANPVYKPNASNPTAAGKECQPRIVDQLITTRVVQTTCPDTVANPCTPATGDKSQQETDFEFAGRPFGRAYHSLGQVEQRRSLAPNWVHSYSDRIFGKPNYLGKALHHFSDRGEIDVFVRQGNTSRFVSETSAKAVLDVEAGNTYKLTSTDGTIRRFNAAGRLTSIASSDSAWRLEFAYEDDRLKTATDHTGRQLRFEYLNGRLSTLRLPDDTTVAYGYDVDGNLHSVQQPDGRTRTYHYNEPGLSDASDVHALTGISDNGQRYATYAYDLKNRARLSQHHANGQVVDKFELVYGANGVVDVTGSRGESRAYATTDAGGYRRTSSVSYANASALTSYTGALPLQTTDRLGNVTRFEYTNGYESARYEAVGTPDERKITTERNAAFRVISRIVSAKAGSSYVPKQQTTYAYNSRGQLTATTVTDPTAVPAVSRTTTTNYCEQADVDAGTCPLVGLVTSVDGPRAGATDVTTYHYRMTDAPACTSTPANCTYRKGDLWKVVNPLGQTTETLSRDGSARELSVRDANGVVTDIEYDALGRQTARKTRGTNDASEADDRITSMTYWPTGEIKRITQPDGTWTQYTYDSAYRMTGVVDNAGNSVTYGLDAAGARESEQTRDQNGGLRRSLSRAYDTLGQLQSQSDAYGRTTSYSYDNGGNADLTTDALQRVTDSDYDVRGRLKRILQNATGGQAGAVETKFEYDALDNLTRVVDPNQLSTTYVSNGFGELKSVQSPDTGTTSLSYDAAGNRESQTDARGVTTVYGYDAVNRITSVSYPSDASLAVTYVYDVAQSDCTTGETFLTGRIAKMTDHSGSTTYCYDRFGQLTRKVQRTQGKIFTVRWQYAANGHLQSMTYPDGSVIDYAYDARGRAREIGLSTEGQPRRKVVHDVLYHPWGGPARWHSMADRVVVRTQDLNGYPGIVQAQDQAGTPLDGVNLGYEFDGVGNLERLRDGNLTDPPVRIYDYDALNRLIEAKDASNVVWQSYTYDKTGNRQSVGSRKVVQQQDCTGVAPGDPCTPLPPTTQWSTDAYTYHTGTHRLFTRTGLQRSYDDAGNLVLEAPLSSEVIDPPSGPGETGSAVYAGSPGVKDDENGGDEPAPPGAVARGYGYNAANRLSSTTLGGEHLMSYRYNGRGERVYRQGIDATVHTVFDASGRWLGDYAADGTIIQQAIWLGEQPVGLLVMVGGTARLFHVEADALGSPRAVVDPTRGTTGTVVWRWELSGDAFGNDKPNDDPDGDGTAFLLDMRFPGQQYDHASGLNYNYFRDYEAATGRYVESDPIGLNGGINTYSYAEQNALVATDPEGLNPAVAVYRAATWGWRIGEFLNQWAQPAIAGSLDSLVFATSYNSSAAAEQVAERRAYSKRCKDPPPGGLTGCDLLRWKLQRNKDCQQMRKDYSKKWFNDNEPNHLAEIANLDRAIEKLEQAIAAGCCGGAAP